MAKIFVCLLGFPLTSIEGLKLSTQWLKRFKKNKITTVAALGASHEHSITHLIALLQDEIETLGAITRAKQILPKEKFLSIFKLCQHSGNPMTSEKYEEAMVNLPVTQAMLELLRNIEKEKFPSVNLDIGLQELKEMTLKMNLASSLEDKIKVQANYEAKRMSEMATHLMKGIKYLEKTGGVLWVTDLRRHHVQGVASLLEDQLRQNPIEGLELQMVKACTPISSQEDKMIFELTEQAFMNLENTSLAQMYKNAKTQHGILDLIATLDDTTRTYHCPTLDSCVEYFIQEQVQEREQAREQAQNRMLAQKISQQYFDQSLKKNSVLDRIIFDLNYQEFSMLPSSLMSWTELMRWCKNAKVS